MFVQEKEKTEMLRLSGSYGDPYGKSAFQLTKACIKKIHPFYFTLQVFAGSSKERVDNRVLRSRHPAYFPC